MTNPRIVTNQNMDIVKECEDEDAAISYIMSQPEDANLEIYTQEEYERLTTSPAAIFPKQEMFVVNEDSTIEIMDDIDDDEIVNMIGSDYYPVVFRKSTYGIEYASVDPTEGTLEWVEATSRKSQNL